MSYTSLNTIVRLIRLPNLLIVAATQFFIYYLLLIPSLNAYSITPLLNDVHFALFVLVTILITIEGYIINDIKDVEADHFNKPDKAVVGVHISVPHIYMLYYALFVIGLMIALYLAGYVDQLILVGLYPLAIGALHLYSTHLKQRVLLGNFLVAFFCAGVAGIVLFAERETIGLLFSFNLLLARQVLFVLCWYMVFAFLSTMYREIIKDLEDLEGDKQQACRTLPIVCGVKTAKTTALLFGLALLSMIILTLIQAYLPFSIFGISLMILLVILPLVVSFYLLRSAQNKKEYHQISQLVKLIMVGGIMLLFTMILTIDFS